VTTASGTATPPYLLTWLALGTLGAITVPTDPQLVAEELAGLVGQVRPSAVITDQELGPGVTNALTATGIAPPVLDVGELVADWAARPSPADDLPVAAAADDLAVLIPTSGTTGR
jgi:acyl-CoA synthetase (AMP-forming)/AMP-acid ligase II